MIAHIADCRGGASATVRVIDLGTPKQEAESTHKTNKDMELKKLTAEQLRSVLRAHEVAKRELEEAKGRAHKLYAVT